MRRLAAALVALVVVASAVIYGMSQPALMEKFVEWTCDRPTERCLVRMRALGHLWSRHQNLERAAHWYRQGADAGDPIAMFHLAWLLERNGVAETIRSAAQSRGTSIELSRHIDEAATWYRRAADAGFAPAMNNLGNLHEQGLLGRRDLQAAFNLYSEAARTGNPVAAFNLSRAYGLGLGTTRNASEAENWAEWSPRQFNAADLAAPTLERTYFGNSDMPVSMLQQLRAVADNGPPAAVRLTLRPLKGDPRVPTFSQVLERHKGVR